MGASTTAQLIAKGQAENGYNNSGINSNGKWVDFFNDALRDLVEDIGIVRAGTISYVSGTREYPLASDYYAMVRITDGSINDCPVYKRRYYEQKYPNGYFIFNRGSSFVIDLYDYMSPRTFSYLYTAYPTLLTTEGANSERPEIPSVGEKALIYYAISKGLRNNNETALAKDYEVLYEVERRKLRSAAVRGEG